MKPSAQPPQRVPVLTEVVVMPERAAEVAEEYPEIITDEAYAATEPAPLNESWQPHPAFAAPKPPPAVDEALLTQHVLADLEKQLDLMFEHKLRETLAPVLTRMTDTLVREMRNQLATSLREMVARAVSAELDRLQKR